MMQNDPSSKMDGSPVGSDTVLEETFYICSKKSAVYKVKLTEKGLLLVKDSNGQSKTETIRIDDIIGARCMRSNKKRSPGSCVCGPNTRKKDLKVVDEHVYEHDENDISAYLYIYAYILKKNWVKSGERRERTTVTLRFRSFDKFEDNFREAQRWKTALKCLIQKRPIPGSVKYQGEGEIIASPDSSIEEQNQVLVLLNPKSGPGRARELFQTKVAPVLCEAEVYYDLYVTKHANYARDFVRVSDIFQWKAVVVVGGDGILFEVINGIFERPDWETVISEICFGIIPCGSGNGLAKAIAHSLHEPYDKNPYLTSSLNIISGNTVPMDIIRVETVKEIMFSFLTIGWGLIADIDIESEKLRAIGSQRFPIWTVARLLGLRTYRGKLMYQKIEGIQKPNDKNRIKLSSSEDGLSNHLGDMHISRSLNDVLCNSTIDNINLETGNSEVDSYSPKMRSRSESFYSVNSHRSTYFSLAGSSYASVNEYVGDIQPRNPNVQIRMHGPASKLPSLTQPVPKNWETVEGDFILVQASYQTHIGTDCFMVPDAKLNDGVIWLMYVKAGISRAQLLQILLGLPTGAHVSSPYLETIPVSAFRIEPDTTTSNHGHITVDGENVDYGPVQAEIFPGLLSIMSR